MNKTNTNQKQAHAYPHDDLFLFFHFEAFFSFFSVISRGQIRRTRGKENIHNRAIHPRSLSKQIQSNCIKQIKVGQEIAEMHSGKST